MEMRELVNARDFGTSYMRRAECDGCGNFPSTIHRPMLLDALVEQNSTGLPGSDGEMSEAFSSMLTNHLEYPSQKTRERSH